MDGTRKEGRKEGRKAAKIAIVGFGGIAKVHYGALLHLKERGVPIKVVAVCDSDEQKIREQKGINLGNQVVSLADNVHIYTDIDALLGDDFDIADICLPSFLHKEITIKMLRAGKHVFVEKPMALHYTDCEEMVRVAKEENRRLMVGQCLRFDPAYLYLKDCIDRSIFGELKQLYLYRFSEYQHLGAAKWFEQTEKCGGCILDTHIHDVDMTRFLLGEPKSVSTVADANVPHWELVDTRLFYPNTTVIARCSWDETVSVPFQMGYRARFEKASVCMENGTVKVF